MPYLSPELVLGRFATFARDDVRNALTEEDGEFMRAQVGSMSSTLEFLSMELDGMGDVVDAQHRALATALDEATTALETIDADAPKVQRAIQDATEQLADALHSDVYDHEEFLTRASEDILAAIDAELVGDEAKIVRAPLYAFLRTRVDEQLHMLGREAE